VRLTALARGAVALIVALLGGTLFTAAALATYPGANGRLLYSDSAIGPTMSVRVDGTDPREVRWYAYSPQLSADGRTVVYVNTRGGVFTAQVTGRNPRRVFDEQDFPQISSSGFVPWSPAISPDARTIVFNANYTIDDPRSSDTDRPRVRDSVYRVNIDGTGLSLIHASVRSPVFSPNGRRVAMITRHNGIVTSRVDGTHFRRVLASGGADRQELDWSPDGRRLLFLRGVWGRMVILDLRTGRQVLVPRAPNVDLLDATFSPDGRRIAYIGQRGYHRTFYTVRVDGTGRRPLFTAPLSVSPAQIAWQPRPR
jgi:Tol biopolymer transport system component